MARLFLASLLLLFALSGQPVEFNPDTLSGCEMSPMERQRQDAERGDPEAQFQLGIAYFQGETIKKDDDCCATWIRKAALAGHPYAQGFLGALYADGVGVPRNDSEAYVWYAVAAANGEEYAAKNLERMARRLPPATFLAAQARTHDLISRIQHGVNTGKPH
jgi:TPR repeat protein